MRDLTFHSLQRPALLVLFLLLLLTANSPWAVAAPALQRETATPAATATACPSGTPAIDGFVFEDLNRDQTLQANEPPLAGVNVSLQTPEGVALAPPQPTTPDGRIFFGPEINLAPGTYRLVQEKREGYETTGGQERLVTVTGCSIVTVFFPNIQLEPVVEPTATGGDPRSTATPGPTLTPSSTPTLSPTVTSSPTATPSPTATGTASPTPTVTPTPTTTTTTTASPTLRALTPIATVITTTPGVVITVVPVPPRIPAERLPETGFAYTQGGTSPIWLALFIVLVAAVGLARRYFQR